MPLLAHAVPDWEAPWTPCPPSASSTARASAGAVEAPACHGRIPLRTATQFVDLKEQAAAVAKEVAALNQQWDTGYTRFKVAWGQADNLRVQRKTLWATLTNGLQDSCLKLRDAVDKLNESRGICDQAQSDDLQGLPSLYQKKAQDPERFARLGPLRGCVDESGQPQECICPTGDEKSGCMAARDNEGHVLACTRIFEKSLEDLHLMDFFKRDGTCRISAETPFNQAVVPAQIFSLPPNAMTIGKASIPMPENWGQLLLVAGQAPSLRDPRPPRRRAAAGAAACCFLG